jgi:hypothetical protein
MTAHVLITGTLFRAPEPRTSKNGKPFVTATIRVRPEAEVRSTAAMRHKRTFPKERWTNRPLCIRAAPQFAESTRRRLRRASQEEPQHFP